MITKLDDFMDGKPPKKGRTPYDKPLVSAPIPDIDGNEYIVTRHPDGHYDCVDAKTGKRDIRRTLHGHCHHVTGMLKAWENVEGVVSRERKLTKKHIMLLNFIKEERIRTNSLVTYNNPDVQKWLGKAIRIVLNAIATHPGVTRRDLTALTSIHPNTIHPAVKTLLDIGLIKEDGVDTDSGNPRAKLYLDEELLVAEQGGNTGK